jgi:cell division septation protein DedD
MPWRSNGDYYMFQEDSIDINAPVDSGVYGLYNLKRQIFIGETANIHKALLHHSREAGVQFPLSRPTGFTFELCPAQSRAQRARELIAEYRPVLQTSDSLDLRRLWRRWLNSGANAFDSYTVIEPENGKDLEAPSTAPKHQAKTRSLSRRQLVVVGSGLLAATVLIVSLALVNGKKGEDIDALENQTEAIAGTSAEPLGNLSPEPVEHSAETPAFAERAPRDQALTESIKLPANQAPSTQANNGTKQPVSPPVKTARIWSVQVRSYSEKEPALAWVERLNAKGYEAFMVEADVRGQIWYRVQVGRFADPQKAESLRQELQARERFSDAFLIAARAPEPSLS